MKFYFIIFALHVQVLYWNEDLSTNNFDNFIKLYMYKCCIEMDYFEEHLTIQDFALHVQVLYWNEDIFKDVKKCYELYMYKCCIEIAVPKTINILKKSSTCTSVVLK